MKNSLAAPPITDEILNAYVDGALHHTQAAHVAHSAASDPKIAERIAVLSQIKAGVAGMVDDFVVIDLPMPVAVPPGRWSLFAAVGAFAALVIAGVSVLWWVDSPDRSASILRDMPIVANADATLKQYIARHDAWIDGMAQTSEVPVFDMRLQDVMAKTGLRLLDHALAPLDHAHEASHRAFIGPNGCRLSLFEAMSPVGQTRPLTIAIDADLLTATWADDGQIFVLIARHMDNVRFSTIATAVHDASRDQSSVNAEALASLTQARQPCLS